MKRSIVTSNYSSFYNDSGQVSEEVSIEDLMYYCLYWDQVIIPGNRAVYNLIDQEEDFLSSGVIIRPTVHHNNFKGDDDLNRIASLELISVYKHFKSSDKSNDYTIHHNIRNNFNQLNHSELIQQQAIRVELAKLLPCPSNTNIFDLLEFKEKRKDELASLHQHLTNLYLDIANTAVSQDLKKDQVFTDFKKSIDDLKKSMDEKFPRKLFFRDLISELKADVTELGAAATADLALATFPSGTIVGGITITTKRVISTILKEQKTDTHLNYVKSSIKDGVVTS